jgi:hypothetical protein
METLTSAAASTLSQGRAGLEPSPPTWACDLVGGVDGEWQKADSGISVRVCDGERFALVSSRVPAVLDFDAAALQQATTDAYRAIGAQLAGCTAASPVRLWNLIPGILDSLDHHPHRYMAFNAGRFNAYLEWFESEQRFAERVPTASGVGHHGCDLVVHCLAARQPGAPVENPRQVSSYRYSDRYGRLPPCFARATMIRDAGEGVPWLLVGGTASVRGEETVHVGDLRAQSDETYANLASLVGAAAEQAGLTAAGRSPAEATLLTAFSHLRVYYVREADRERIAADIAARFPSLESVELLNAALCRPRLLIEIEGVARLEGAAVRPV